MKRTPSPEFMEIPVEDKTSKKVPKRRVYFSDGYLDEYSTDEEVDSERKTTQSLVDQESMTWLPYMWYMTWWMGSKVLSVCDYLGEHLAYFLGITSPKFQYEIEQYQKLLEEEETLKKKIASENAGWECTSATTCSPIEMAPFASHQSIGSQYMLPCAKEGVEKTCKAESEACD